MLEVDSECERARWLNPRQSVNNELERRLVWKEAVMDYVHYTGIWMEGLSKTTKTGFGAKI